jgi:hypothetical protein
MKKIIIAPLFTMLAVSCGTVLPSQSQSSVVSQVSSSSIATTSTATSSSEITSSSTPSSSTPSSSEEPLSNRKVPFNQIGSLVAQVVDAKAMGIINSKDRVQQNSRRNQEGGDQNYMVKVTENYNPNTQITEDQTIQVTFTRVTNTQTTELQTGTSTLVATADPITIERVTDLPGNIVITNVFGYEFRLLSGETVVEDWISSDLETIEFIFDEALTDLVVESRSLNASISFISFEEFTYTIKKDDVILFESLIDNDSNDENDAIGVITLSGLIEGSNYGVTYSGYKIVETITQDDVDGQIDKLYVAYDYTFISFVPIGINQRPLSQNLTFDKDDIAIYDKQDYYTNSSRQSFIIYNTNGLIYKLENFVIDQIEKGLVKSGQFVYDLKIVDGNLNIFPLTLNSSIKIDSFFKDRYGHNYIYNDKITYFDSSTDTYFYRSNQKPSFSSWVFDPFNNYYIFSTKSGDAVLFRTLRWDMFQTTNPNMGEYYLIGSDWNLNFVDNDKTYIINSFMPSSLNSSGSGYITEIRNGKAFIIENGNENMLLVYEINREDKKVISIATKGNMMLLGDFIVFVQWGLNRVFYIEKNNWFENLNLFDFDLTDNLNFENFLDGYSLSSKLNLNPAPSDFLQSNSLLDYFDEMVFDGSFNPVFFSSNTHYSAPASFTVYNINGNTTYIVGVKYYYGKWVPELFIEGNYTAPDISINTVILQPINK